MLEGVFGGVKVRGQFLFSTVELIYALLVFLDRSF